MIKLFLSFAAIVALLKLCAYPELPWSLVTVPLGAAGILILAVISYVAVSAHLTARAVRRDIRRFNRSFSDF